MTISTEAIKSALSALIDPVTGTDYVSGKMFKSAETDENGNVAAYITTGAARPIPQESPARTARCVASEEAMSSPHLPAPKSHHSVGCAREDEAGLCPKATVYGSFHLRFPSRSLKAIMRNRPVDCKRRCRIETGNLLLASLMVKNKCEAAI